MPAYWAKKAPGSCKQPVSLLVTSVQFYPMYREIRRDKSTPLNHICLIGEQLPADDGVSHFTQLQSRQSTTLCYTPALSTDDTAEILYIRHHLTA